MPQQVSLLVVAHGMGCRLVAEALGNAETGNDVPPGSAVRCIFAAPDVVPDRFLHKLSLFPTESRCVCS